jgi:citrate lyase subunit beta/citryl-CoA lyase
MDVPGNDPRKLEKAKAMGMDVAVLDLEDSVPLTDEEKRAGRKCIAAALEAGPYRAREIAIRVNEVSSPWCLDDVRFAVEMDVDTILLPKPRGVRDVAFVDELLTRLGASDRMRIILPVEVPQALLELEQIVRTVERVDGLLCGGSFDYTLETSWLRLLPTTPDNKGAHMSYARQYGLAVARAYDLSIIQGILVANPRDLDAVREYARQARFDGYDGGGIFYPPQIAVLHEVFAPQPEELAWAKETIDLWESRLSRGEASIIHNDRIVLPQHYKLAQRLVEHANRLALADADRGE